MYSDDEDDDAFLYGTSAPAASVPAPTPAAAPTEAEATPTASTPGKSTVLTFVSCTTQKYQCHCFICFSFMCDKHLKSLSLVLLM
jgi:hypothetical protein